MLSRLRSHVRHNVVGYLALFFALSGTALGANAALKVGDPAGGDLTGTYPNPSIAANAVNSGKVSNNSLTGDDIGNLTRSVNLPLGSFVDADTRTYLDGSSGADSAPDFAIPFSSLVIEYDTDDNDVITSTFTVPQDTVAGNDGSLALRVSKNANGAAPEFMFCGFAVNGSTNNVDGVEITTAANTSYSVPFPPLATYAPGDSIAVECNVPTGGDDAVRIHSIEFRYTATQ